MSSTRRRGATEYDGATLKDERSKMAYANTHTAATSITDRFSTMLARIADDRAKRRVYNTTLRELNMLSNRDLNDLGISHADIEPIAYKAAYGK